MANVEENVVVERETTPPAMTTDPSDKPLTREVRELKIVIPNTEYVTDDEILSYYDSIKDYTAIELLHDIQLLEKDKRTVDSYKEFFDSTVETYSDLLKATKDLRSLNAENTGIASFRDVIPDEQIDEFENLDIKDLKKNVEEFGIRTQIGQAVLKLRYDELRANNEISLKTDIIEILTKNLATIEQSEDLNKELFKSDINKIIDELKTNMDTGLNPLDRMSSKLSNPKRTKDIIKEVRKNNKNAMKEIRSVGFTDEMLQSFANFHIKEAEYFQFINHDYDPTIDDCIAMLHRFSNDEIQRKYIFYSMIFFYHIARIVKSELKKRNYLSLIYKCYVLQIVEIMAKDIDTFRATPEAFEKRKELTSETNSDAFFLSEVRKLLFLQYDKIFSKYLEVGEK